MTCQNCGVEIIRKRGANFKQLYCSDTCRVRSRNEAKRKWLDSNPEARKKACSDWYKKNLVRESDRAHDKQAKLRSKVLALLGGACAHCGYSNPIALQIDHISGDASADKGIGPHARYNRIIKDQTGYQILCANCNIIKKIQFKEYGRRCRTTRQKLDHLLEHGPTR